MAQPTKALPITLCQAREASASSPIAAAAAAAWAAAAALHAGPTIVAHASPAPAISRMRYPRFGGWHLSPSSPLPRLVCRPLLGQSPRLPRWASAWACAIAQPTNALPIALCHSREASAKAPIAAALQAEIVRPSRRLPRRHYRHHGDADRPPPGLADARRSKLRNDCRQSRYQPVAVSAATSPPNSPRFDSRHRFPSKPLFSPTDSAEERQINDSSTSKSWSASSTVQCIAIGRILPSHIHKTGLLDISPTIGSPVSMNSRVL